MLYFSTDCILTVEKSRETMLQKNNTKTQILDSARRAFGRFGYDKTSLLDIAKLAGLGKATLYYYYASKQELFFDVVRHEADVFMSMFNEKFNLCKTATEKLESYLDIRLSHHEQLSSLLEIDQTELNKIKMLAEQGLIDFRKNEFEMIHKIMREGIELGEFTDKDSSLMAFSFLTLFRDLDIDWMISGQKFNRKATLRLMASIVITGIQKG